MDVLVDTSIWLDYFRGGNNAKDLDFLIDENFILTNDIILAKLIPFLMLKKQTQVIRLLYEIIENQMRCLKGGANGVGIPA